MELLNKVGKIFYSDESIGYIDCFHGHAGHPGLHFFYTNRGEFCIGRDGIYKYDRMSNELIPTDEIKRIQRLCVNYIDVYPTNEEK